MDLQQLLDNITPEIYQRLKRAVETGRWPDGNKLSDAQRGLCLQAIIAFDQRKPEDERVGFLPRKNSVCESDEEAAEKPLAWKH